MSEDGPPRRVNFSACKMGLRPRKRAFSGLGLDFSVAPSASPADRLASPFDGLAGTFARLAEKWACAYFSSPKAYLITLSRYTVQCKCILPGLAIFPVVLLTEVRIRHRRQRRHRATLSIHDKITGLPAQVHSASMYTVSRS
jgi:hypothetical protein